MLPKGLLEAGCVSVAAKPSSNPHGLLAVVTALIAVSVVEPRQEREFCGQRLPAKLPHFRERRPGSARPKTKNPANGGPFSTVSVECENSRLGGGGCSLAKPVSRVGRSLPPIKKRV
jgi:hypothetical protein